MSKWVKRLKDGFSTGLIAAAVREWIWPLLLTVVPSALLWLENMQLGQLALAALFAFTCSVWAMLGMSRWRYSQNPEDKLSFLSPYVAADKTNDGQNLSNIQVGFELKNNAEFPISYRVEKIITTADNTLPEQQNFLNKGGIVPSGGHTLFRDSSIALKVPKSAMDASLEVALLYGRPGNERYSVSKKIEITINYAPESGRVNWHWFDRPDDS